MLLTKYDDEGSKYPIFRLACHFVLPIYLLYTVAMNIYYLFLDGNGRQSRSRTLN